MPNFHVLTLPVSNNSCMYIIHMKLNYGLCTGDQLFDPMWEAIYRLERLGLKVLAVCCDGLAANRRLFGLHSPGSKELLYKVRNPHAHEDRYLFFVSDPPHLIKTVRNCWSNNKRKLWVRCTLS